MLVQEVISRKEYLKLKLKDLDYYILKLETLNIKGKGAIYNKVINDKFVLLSKIRSHEVLIDKLLKENNVKIGNSEITVYEANALLETTKNQLDTFSTVISKGDLNSLDVFSLLKERDVIFEEYILLFNVVTSSNAEINWNMEEEKE